MRFVTYAVPAIWLSGRPDFRIEYVWYLSIATVTLQAPPRSEDFRMHNAPTQSTKSNAAAAAAGVVTVRALTGKWIGFATRFATDMYPSLAAKRIR